RAPDHSRGAVLLQAGLDGAAGRRPGTDQEVRARSADGRARALGQVRADSDGEGEGGRLRERADRRQGAVPGGGETREGPARPEIPGDDQAHAGDRVTRDLETPEYLTWPSPIAAR